MTGRLWIYRFLVYTIFVYSSSLALIIVAVLACPILNLFDAMTTRKLWGDTSSRYPSRSRVETELTSFVIQIQEDTRQNRNIEMCKIMDDSKLRQFATCTWDIIRSPRFLRPDDHNRTRCRNQILFHATTALRPKRTAAWFRRNTQKSVFFSLMAKQLGPQWTLIINQDKSHPDEDDESKIGKFFFSFHCLGPDLLLFDSPGCLSIPEIHMEIISARPRYSQRRLTDEERRAS